MSELIENHSIDKCRFRICTLFYSKMTIRYTKSEDWFSFNSDILHWLLLRNFNLIVYLVILPGGGKTAASLHLARAVCRRLERSLPQLVEEQNLDQIISIYINRLSDLLFVLARYSSFKENREEVVYKKSQW